MQRTLKRELKVLEIVKREAIWISEWRPPTHSHRGRWFAVGLSRPPWRPTDRCLARPGRSTSAAAESASVGGGAEGSEEGGMVELPEGFTVRYILRQILLPSDRGVRWTETGALWAGHGRSPVSVRRGDSMLCLQLAGAAGRPSHTR